MPAAGEIWLVTVRTRAKETNILEMDQTSKTMTVALKAMPVEGKANAELLKFLRRQFGVSAKLKSGVTSKIKRIAFY